MSIGFQHPSQMRSIHDDQMVETFTADRTDATLRRIAPRIRKNLKIDRDRRFLAVNVDIAFEERNNFLFVAGANDEIEQLYRCHIFGFC